MHHGTIAVYDAEAQRWSQTRDPAKAEGTSHRRSAAALRQRCGDGIIVDLGCGPAKLVDALGPDVVGVDASTGMLALAREATDTPLCRADVEFLPFREGTLAGAFANFSLQHLPRDGFDRALAEVARVLRRGGDFVLAVHQGTFEGDDRPGDDLPGRWFTYWQADDLHAALANMGGTDIVIEDEVHALRASARVSLRSAPAQH